MTPSTVIRLDHVRFGWSASDLTLALDHLAIQRTEKLFIQGPSGSGKTTLLGLLGGILIPDSGRVNVLGASLDSLSSVERDHFRANHIGFIFQQFNLIPYLSVIDNIILPLQFAGLRQQHLRNRSITPVQEALRLLSQLGLSDPALHARPVTELSIGQQQRVAAARALIGQPEIIIADEPTSSLDSDNTEAFIRLLFSECEASASTLIFVSHDCSLEPLFDRSIMLNKLNKAATAIVEEQ